MSFEWFAHNEANFHSTRHTPRRTVGMREYYIINDEMSEQKHVDGRQNAKVVESETNDNDGDEYQVETHK